MSRVDLASQEMACPKSVDDDDTLPNEACDASVASSVQSLRGEQVSPVISQTPRTPVVLVTILDTSGSMAGTKLALLKRAMGFVIQNLSSNDRLSVIAFSSTARRLFPLSRMSESGKQNSLLAVNSLVGNGGTNIAAEGLRKGAKVMEERREKNPVASIILLSDGQDTSTVEGSTANQTKPNYQLLLPLSIQSSNGSGFKIPVHTFGFGADHAASLMHSISEISGGTFSFIETEATIQDAFAQCIGGLLSVIVQELQVEIECVHSGIRLQSVNAGSYSSYIVSDGCSGKVEIGDLYADEERDILVMLNVPAESSSSETTLLRVKCLFKDPLTKESLTLEGKEVKIQRPVTSTVEETRSIEVDRQQNRLQAAEAISQARAAAEQGSLSDAVSILEDCREMLCVALDAELKEMQERMGSRHVYEASGRAYVLSGLSSHSWQRAIARVRDILLLSSKLKLLTQAIKGKGCIDVPIEQEVNLLVCYSTVGIRTPRVPVIHFVSKFAGTSRVYILNINTDREIVKLGMEDGRLIGFCAKGTGWIEYIYDDIIEFVNYNNDDERIVTSRPTVDVDQHEGLFSGSPGAADFTSVLVCVNFVHGQQMQQRIDILVYRNGVWVPFVDIREVANARFSLGMALEGKTLMVLDGSRRFYFIDVDTFRTTYFEVPGLLRTVIFESSIICVNNGWYVVIMTDDGRKLFQVDLEREILVENVVLEESVSIACINGKQGFGYYAPVDSLTKGFIVDRRESDREECRCYAGDDIYSVRDCSELTINSVCRCRFAFYIT